MNSSGLPAEAVICVVTFWAGLCEMRRDRYEPKDLLISDLIIFKARRHGSGQEKETQDIALCVMVLHGSSEPNAGPVQNTQHPSVSQRNVRQFLLLCSYPAWFNPSQHFLSHFPPFPPGTDFVQQHFYISCLPFTACLITHLYHINQKTFQTNEIQLLSKIHQPQ